MNFPSIKSLNTFDKTLLILFTILFIYIYSGFFFPDSYILSYGKNPARIMWALRIILPIVYFGILLLYIKVRLRKIEISFLSFLLISSIIVIYISYNIADVLYQNWFDANRKEYHPYLQIMPNDYSPSANENSNTIKIFFLGGSTTEIPDKTGIDWPSRVENILHTKYNIQNVEVYNLGRQWYTSLHSLINYETNLRMHNPSYIVIMQSVNDLLHNADFSYFSKGKFRDDYGHFYGPVNRVIDRRSLWKYLSDIVGDLWYAKPRKEIVTGNFPGISAYKRNINTIIELANHDSTKVILMSEPHLLKDEMTEEELSAVLMLKLEAINDSVVWNYKTVLNGMEQYNNSLKDIANENDLFFIDLDNKIPKSLIFFHDEVHYQDTTYPIIASYIAEELNKILSLNDK